MASKILVPYNIRYLFLAHICIGSTSTFALYSSVIQARRSPYLCLVAEGTKQWQKHAQALKTSVQTTVYIPQDKESHMVGPGLSGLQVCPPSRQDPGKGLSRGYT